MQGKDEKESRVTKTARQEAEWERQAVPLDALLQAAKDRFLETARTAKAANTSYESESVNAGAKTKLDAQMIAGGLTIV